MFMHSYGDTILHLQDAIGERQWIVPGHLVGVCVGTARVYVIPS